MDSFQSVCMYFLNSEVLIWYSVNSVKLGETFFVSEHPNKEER